MYLALKLFFFENLARMSLSSKALVCDLFSQNPISIRNWPFLCKQCLLIRVLPPRMVTKKLSAKEVGPKNLTIGPPTVRQNRKFSQIQAAKLNALVCPLHQVRLFRRHAVWERVALKPLKRSYQEWLLNISHASRS